MERLRSDTASGPRAEALHATALKCDIVQSTEIKRRLDAEDQLNLDLGYEEFVKRIAEQFGGHPQPFEGDGALVVFYSQEDAAEKAVQMAFRLVEAIGKADLAPNVQPQLRVGIASGELAVVKHPSTPKEVAGVAIAEADRLMKIAQPDQVIIADNTKRLFRGAARGLFDCTRLELTSAKGFEDGLTAWRVDGVLPDVRDQARGEIVGRSKQLARLRKAWAAAQEGRGQTVCLIGEAGIGKSRLARAALDKAANDGAFIVRLDCTPSTGNTPLYPVAVLLRRAAKIASTASEQEKLTKAENLLSQYLPPDELPTASTYLGPLFGLQNAAVPANTGPDEIRDRTISIVVKMVASLAIERPLVVLCEDLHWVDDTTAKVLARVCDEIASMRVLMILTMRPISRRLPLDLSKFTNIRLRRLSNLDAAALVRKVTKDVTLTDEIVARIIHRCEGLPLVLEEVARSEMERVNARDQTSKTVTQTGDVPAPLQLVVQSRLDRWPRFERIVKMASVLGREFSLRLLERMLPESPPSQIAEAIETLGREGLFSPPNRSVRDRVRFKHVMISEAVYNTLLRSDRQRHHSAVADILAGEYSGMSDATPEAVAEHLKNARRFGEAIRVRLAAGRDTAARGAYVESEGHCTKANDLVKHLQDPEERRTLQFALLIQLGVARTGKHGYSAAIVEETYRRARALCDDSAEAQMLYPIMRGLATINLVRGNLETAYDLSMEALRLAEQSERAEFRIDAMSVLCYTALYYKGLKECDQWIANCLELYHAHQGDELNYPVPQNAKTAALALVPTVAWLLGDSHRAEDAIREGLEHVERLNRDFDRALLHAWIAGTRYTQRRYAETVEHAGIAIGISQQKGYREWFGTGALLALMAQAASSANPQALAGAAAACMEFAKEGVGLNASYYLLGLARSYALVGEVATARYMLSEAFGRASSSKETRMNAELWIFQAELEPDDGYARELLLKAFDLAQEQGAVATRLRAAAEIALRLGADEMRKEYARITRDMLDGRVAYPEQRNWMHERLTAIRETIDARSEAPVAV
jgi:predicted ATPase/class 3 adenylate cyclase